MVKLAIDMMGGDNAPDIVLETWYKRLLKTFKICRNYTFR